MAFRPYRPPVPRWKLLRTSTADIIRKARAALPPRPPEDRAAELAARYAEDDRTEELLALADELRAAEEEAARA